MRNLLTGLYVLLLLIGIAVVPSCGGGGSSGGAEGDLIADYDLEGEDYLADPDTALERFCKMFSIPRANAISDLGWDQYPWPYTGFTGERNVAAGRPVRVLIEDVPYIAEDVTDASGRVRFSNLPIGFVTLAITGADGHQYLVPVEISEGVTSHTKALVSRNPLTGTVEISAKTIHDSDGDGSNDDLFSLAVYGRPRNFNTGGVIIRHEGNTSYVDNNGDGDVNDPGDETITEPDDDGISSDAGDGDEDNDGIPDNADDDIDGDGIPNDEDPDIDGDGIPNESDTYPDGITPNDDFTPPHYGTGEPYPGIDNLAQIDTDTITVTFWRAHDNLTADEDISYNIYYSTTSPINFDTAERQRFRPINPDTPDDRYNDNITALITGQIYYVAVRAMDAAQPPNEDTNTVEMEIYIEAQ